MVDPGLPFLLQLGSDGEALPCSKTGISKIEKQQPGVQYMNPTLVHKSSTLCTYRVLIKCFSDDQWFEHLPVAFDKLHQQLSDLKMMQ